MRLLVAPNELTIGGTQINAIDLATRAARAGHEVVVYGIPGPLVERVRAHGLEFVPARPLRYRPAPSRIAQLAVLARRRRFDLIHAYEWPGCLDAYYGAHLLLGVPLVCTVLSMSVSGFVPSSVPLIMGTADLGEQARRVHRAPVWVLEPPIDSESDRPDVDPTPFRAAHGLDGSLLVATVSRLAVDLKLDALVRAIDAVDLLAGRLPVQLAVVGGGPAEDALRARAAAVNDRWGRPVIVFTGPLDDPRPAYAAADVVVGMGSSALRAMSIGRAVVVQGERGFSEICEPASWDHFLTHGFWGVGDDSPTADRLAGQLEALLTDAERRSRLGRWNRLSVEERFSLLSGAARQLQIYREVLELAQRRRAGDAARVAGRALRLELEAHDPRRKVARRRAEQSLLAAAARAASPPVGERLVTTSARS
jgi:glycosyltransferase involved in cell wall biosynthesis